MQNASRGEKGERDEDRDVGRKEGERGKEERNGSIQPVEEQMTNRQLKSERYTPHQILQLKSQIRHILIIKAN